MILGYVGREVGAFSFGPPQNGFQMKLWQLDIRFGSAVMTDQTFTVVGAFAPGADSTGLAAVSVEELPTSGGFNEWDAAGGSVKVLSLLGDTATLAVTATGFQPAIGGSGNGATGSFTLTGQITVDDVNQPLPTN
jgi:hypothetical protein